MKTYSTRFEAIQAEIVEPIEASGIVADAREEFDIGAITDRVIEFIPGEGLRLGSYACKVDEAEFWAIVQENAR